MFKKIAVLAACVATTAAAIAFPACNGAPKKYGGEYSVEQFGLTYGFKLEVEVQPDGNGDRIKEITVLSCDYLQNTPDMPEAGWSADIWSNGLDSLLLTYRGSYLADVLALFAGGGERPEGVSDPAYVITGASQSSARFLLAVQNALEAAAGDLGYIVVSGKYSVESVYAPGAYYGAEVKIVVKDGKIAKVAINPYSELILATDIWEDRAVWENSVAALLESYKGKSVEELENINYSQDSGIASPPELSAGGVLVTGASQSSGRLLRAVQNALSKLPSV